MRPSRLLAAFAGLLVQFLFAAMAQSTFPPTPSVKLAVNPVTNKVYVTDTDNNTVTAFDMNAGTSTTIPVGTGPLFIAVNPETNRVFVDNGRDASLTMIDGATDTVIGTYPVGSTGPISVNTITGIVYIVRLTGTGSDEVTFFDANTDTPTWYTIATNSFQPNAMAVNTATDTIYVAHYATGDVKVISGAFNPNDDFPAGVSVGVFSHPFAVAANPVTNKVYVITQDARGPISIIDGATNDNFIPPIPAGHAQQPQAIAVNPLTNKVYAAFANEVVVIDGATNALRFVPVPGSATGPVSIAINAKGNRILVASAQGSLSVIDGDTDTVVSTTPITAGTSVVGYNALTDTAFFFDTTLTSLAGTGGTTHAVPIATSIAPFAGNTTGPHGTVTFNATSNFGAGAPPVHKVFYRLDASTGPWLAADGTGPFTATLPTLPNGPHTITAFAVDSQEATTSSGPQSAPIVGPAATYSFTVTGAKAVASVSLASSANPSTVGQAIVLTASVTGASGAPTGTVTFNDGTTAICSAVALANGSATCNAAALGAGSHSITALYSGDATYDPAVSAAVNQSVTKLAASVALASSANPAAAGQAVSLTATVTATGGTPGGSVAFLDGGSTIAGCGAITLAGRTASCNASSLAVGTHALTARYSGDATFDTATSAAVSQAVTRATPAVTLASSANPSLSGQSVTFTATVSGSAGTATGSITFADGGTALAGCSALALSGGNASCTTAGLSAGAHAITAQYAGDATYAAATSTTLNQSVNMPEKIAATVALASSANPSVSGASVTFTATVSGAGATPTGAVSFFGDGNPIAGCASLALATGSATCATSALTQGPHAITAQYSGDATYNPATSSALSQAVNPPPKVAAHVALGSSANPSIVGASVTFTATVSGANGTPTGTVSFFGDTNAIAGCSALPLASGSASCTSSALAQGTHAITAQYSGDTAYNPATSSALSQAVNPPPKVAATVTLASSSNPSQAGTAVTFTATVSGARGTPTGTVSFFGDANPIAGCGAVAMSSGGASCATGALAQGSHAITAQYSGDAAYNPAASSALTQSVTAVPPPPQPKGDLSVAVSASATSMNVGGTVTFAVTTLNAGPDTATGVALTASIPPGATFVSASAGCSSGANTVSCNIGTLGANTSMQVAIVLRADSAGTLTVSANAHANETDPVPGNNSASATVSVGANQVQPASSVVNLSTRGRVGIGNDVLIGGFVIGGSVPKTVVVVAQGPSLAPAGIANPLANPKLTLVRSSDGAILAVNDDWADAANAADVQAAGFAPPNARESAVMMTLPPGAYTAIVEGADGGSGVGIAAVFEVDHPEAPLVNIATRGEVLTGNDVMIGGFVIQGSSPQTVVITGIGPSLAKAGIANALPNPTLTLVRSSDQSIVATNDDWGSAPNAAQIVATGLAPADAQESAIMVTLAPGAYTAILSGAGGVTGVGLVAVYRP